MLVVESDDDQRRLIGRWLDEAGYSDVMFCPGPAAPDYTCLGGRGVACPLANAADVIVIDLQLQSDDMLTGTPGWQLLIFYMELGRPIVVISGQDDPVRPRPDGKVRVIKRPAERDELLEAIKSMTSIYVA